MKAQDLQLTQLLEGSKQFIIPIFQRTYSWERSHCEQLWKDIIRVGSSSELDSHFIGSVVYIPEESTGAAISRWLVIDGQQRITTITLLLLAFMRRLKSDNLEDPVTADLIEDYFLKNRYGKGELSYKMLLTRTDKESLNALVDGKNLGEGDSHRISENFAFFTQQMATADLGVVYRGLQKLMIVDVRLQHGIDNPQMIFESMNSTGKALTQADLIRNFILMRLDHDLQTRLYNDYWRPMEVEFGAENYIRLFDEFVRYFLVIQTRNPKIRRRDVYDEFKAYARRHDVEDLLASLKEFAGYYCRLALGKEAEPAIANAVHDIRELKVDVCYPMLMEVYEDYVNNLISKEEFSEILRMVESYVFRRVVCDIPTNSLNQTFASFMRQVDKDHYVESVQATFLLLPSYRRFPGNEEFVRLIQIRNMYKFNRRSYWLRRYENFGRKERVYVQDYTIEHIMPQNESLSQKWRDDLGQDWERIHEQYLHTLGNLTLTGYNSEYSDRPFAEKRGMEGGFAHSPLKLNDRLGQQECWNEGAIQERAMQLANNAAAIWEAPSLDVGVLDSYRPKDKKRAEYSITDHRHLAGGLPGELFTALRSEVLALDECVSEEFKKLYVAYKAETNFVDVVPQAKRLLLILNMEFQDLDDPRGICEDLTNRAQWGNGNVQVGFKDIEDLGYILGLIDQALEAQLGVASEG